VESAKKLGKLPARCLVLGLALIWAFPTLGLAQTFRMVQSQQQLYAGPNFGAEIVGTVPGEVEVMVLQQSGDWYQVDYQGKKGWLPQQAFPVGKKLDLSTLLKGRAVPTTRTDEVALAGKGFTPEVEAGYRQKNPQLNYAAVDTIEQFKLPPVALQAFIREGGLQP